MDALDDSIFESRPVDKNDENVQNYIIREDGFEEVKKRITSKKNKATIIGAAVSIAILLVYQFYLKDDFDFQFIAVYIPILSVFLFVSSRRTTKKLIEKQKSIFAGYELFVTTDSISRVITGYPSITIMFADIRDIMKSKDGALLIRSKTTVHDIISVPAQLQNFEELEQKLVAIKPISGKNTLLKYQILRLIISVGLIATMFIVATAEDVWILLGAIVLLLVYIVWVITVILKSKNVDKQGKRTLYLSILLPLGVILFAVFKLLK